MEEELARVENDDGAEDAETMMRAATVHVHDATDSKYLGPSSGIAITRLVMQLAKTFTDSRSIKEIIPELRARQIKELYNQEQGKPTSKIYPLISDVAAAELPNRPLTDLLVTLYKLKVQPLYPALHEPTLDKDVDAVYDDVRGATSVQHFVVRMVIAVSLQKMDTQYAGLADSYYLAALKHLDAVVQPMDMKTLQCFALMAEYSLLTPTRTAIYYVMGIAVRLAQALGYNEEKTITRGRADGQADFLENDMRRRIFWCIFVMECGLAHSLGRPNILATSQEHIDVGWFETCDDKYIKSEGIDPMAPRPTLKKWVAIHFFKMRLLQLEIRRKLYQRKRAEPKDDKDPWFTHMEAKLCAWRDASPSQDEGAGLDKVWFIGRYNTIVVFLYRPSPQVPRPSLSAAFKCFDACQYNIYMSREQIARKTVDLTWIFTQAIFMAINTILWSLSYVEVRRTHSRASVEKHLEVAMEAIQLASERWPGVASAIQLYHNLINAVLNIYEKDGDVPVSATTPSDQASSPPVFQDAFNQSRGNSPGTVSSTSVCTPPERPTPFGLLQQPHRRSVEQPPPVPYSNDSHQMLNQATQHTPPANHAGFRNPSSESTHTLQSASRRPSISQQMYFDPNVPFNPLPDWTPDLLAIPTWSAPQHPQRQYGTAPEMLLGPDYDAYGNPIMGSNDMSYPFLRGPDLNRNEHSNWDMEVGSFGNGLNQSQQAELLFSLETDGMEDIQSMITAVTTGFTPKPPSNTTFQQ